MASAIPSPLAPRAVARPQRASRANSLAGSPRASDPPQLLERALDMIDYAFRAGEGHIQAEAALRRALVGATGRTSGAAGLAEQMGHWYREVPDHARVLSRAALAERMAALLSFA